jgi:hypothetical protein
VRKSHIEEYNDEIKITAVSPFCKWTECNIKVMIKVNMSHWNTLRAGRGYIHLETNRRMNFYRQKGTVIIL